jgi:small subunit ribosomal protein S6
MNEYELVVLLHPDLEIDLEKPLAKVEQILTDNGGKVLKKDNWGKRKLAYPIRKEDFAVYVYYELELPTQSLKKINNTFNITDEVLRFLLTKEDPRAEKAAAAAAERAANANSETKE